MKNAIKFLLSDWVTCSNGRVKQLTLLEKIHRLLCEWCVDSYRWYLKKRYLK